MMETTSFMQHDAPAPPPEESSGGGASFPATTTTSTATIVLPLPLPRRAADILSTDEGKRLYWDRSHYDSPAAQMRALKKSSTLYVGNLAFTTRSRNIRAHFAQIGEVKNIHMGLDRLKKTPCGFCFVEYCDRADALAAVSHLSGTKLDGNVIRVELDAGFQPGRQYGRGISGGQVRDDRKSSSRRGSDNNKRSRDSMTSSRDGGSNMQPMSKESILSSALSTPRSAPPPPPRSDDDGDGDRAEGQQDENGGDDGGGRRNEYVPTEPSDLGEGVLDGGDDGDDMERQAKRQRTF